jgi:tetratricopeptide (TPR) repeat protein
MKLRKIEYFDHLFATTILSLIITLVLFDFALSFELVGWYSTVSGYEFAVKEAQEKESPMILFFYSDSDESSQRLKDEYLGIYNVVEFLSDTPKATIDLNGGEFEKAVAAQYGVEQNPTLFVIFPSLEIEPQGVTPFLEDHDMTVDEFIENLRGIFILAYGDRAYEYFEEEDYENALKYFEIAKEFDAGRAYPYFAIGTVYHAIAIEENSLESITKAEENYLKALEIDPDYKECKEELEKLRNDIDKIAVR